MGRLRGEVRDLIIGGIRAVFADVDNIVSLRLTGHLKAVRDAASGGRTIDEMVQDVYGNPRWHGEHLDVATVSRVECVAGDTRATASMVWRVEGLGRGQVVIAPLNRHAATMAPWLVPAGLSIGDFPRDVGDQMDFHVVPAGK